ncbi:MAG TPA: DUF5989 family protein [Kofleriaceae bacterium]|nr:DUF5989 family protein [Kofleriaceae bacterium]
MLRRLRHLFRLAVEVVDYSVTNRVTWLIPVILLLLAAGLVVATAHVTAPFIYTLF